jgi:hypothetical protein
MGEALSVAQRRLLQQERDNQQLQGSAGGLKALSKSGNIML